ncbi:MAG: glycosyltransferase family 2 protein [Calothrix sp. SM1_7_51]|nr:glycosyltransferase family 2 protein [Calothrix sp. SM1_7_51]
MSANFVSVIIPVYNDSERLKICLQSLENQTYSKESYEIIVVDNASKEDIKSVVSQFSQAKYTYESQPGSYVARNQGISIAKGEILAFTDADCIPDSDWIEKGVSCLVDTPNCGLVAGRIDLFFQKSEQPNVFELYDCIEMSFSQEEFVREDGFGATANIFAYKHIVEQVGCFDCMLKSGGDRQFGKKIAAAGYKAVYADDARIAHPARHSFSQIRTRIVSFCWW